MNIEHLRGNFGKRKNLTYELGEPASQAQLQKAENKLKIIFPNQLRLFYTHYNGLKVEEPSLEILQVENLTKQNNVIHFCNINNHVKLCFDCEKINQAGQWNIVTCEDSFVITLTFSSFWSNKIWAWIDKRREIWKPFEEE